jgi:hypothetical protein
MSPPPSEAQNIGATILDSGGIQTLDVGRALGEVSSALSAESSGSRSLYAIVVYKQNDRGRPTSNLDTWNAVFRAFWQSWRRLALTRFHWTSPDEDNLTTFRKRDLGDICVYWGRGTAKDVKQKIDPSPGVYLLLSHLDTESLGLPAFPEPFREESVVVQVKKIDEGGEPGSKPNEWNPWETLARSVTNEEHLVSEMERDTFEWRKRFMSENKTWSSAQVARESGSSARNRAAIASRWVSEKRIFSLPFAGKIWFPRFQFRDGRPIPAISKVIRMFPDHSSGWDLAYFFTTPNSFIGGRKPLELLSEGSKRLESLARSFVNPADVF